MYWFCSREGTCDGLILHLNPSSGCPLWPIFASWPCNSSVGQTPVIFSVTKISRFTGSAHASGDLHPEGLLAFDTVVQISHILEKSSKNLTWSQRGVWERWISGAETTLSGLPLPCHKSAAETAFDRQSTAKKHRNKPVFQIFALSNMLPRIFWFGDRKYTWERCKKSHPSFVRAGTRHPRWGCCEATSILGLNLNCAPLSSHFAPEHHHPPPTRVSGLTRDWHLHVRAYRCNQTVPRRTRTPWPWRSLLACWWPGTFKKHKQIQKKYIIKNREKLLNKLFIPHQRFKQEFVWILHL